MKDKKREMKSVANTHYFDQKSESLEINTNCCMDIEKWKSRLRATKSLTNRIPERKDIRVIEAEDNMNEAGRRAASHFSYLDKRSATATAGAGK